MFSLIIFEVLCFILFSICCFDAYQKKELPLVIIGVIYGIALENLTILTLSFYEYGPFYFILADTPLAIGLAWSVIIYSAIRIAKLKVQGIFPQAALSAIIAVVLDLGMDVIAIREGYWIWKHGGYWFGVPFLNFVAWVVVVLVFTWVYQFCGGQAKSTRSSLTALVVSLLVLIPGDWLLLTYTHETQHLVLFLLMFTYCIYVVRKGALTPIDRSVLVPSICLLILHSFFLINLILGDYQTPAIWAVSMITFGIGILLHGKKSP